MIKPSESLRFSPYRALPDDQSALFWVWDAAITAYLRDYQGGVQYMDIPREATRDTINAMAQRLNDHNWCAKLDTMPGSTVRQLTVWVGLTYRQG